MSLIRRLRTAFTSTGTVTFCDACSQVQICDAGCYATAARGRAINTALFMGRR